MKRILILATAAITACSGDPFDPGTDAPSGVVTFSTDPATRGTPIENAAMPADIGTFGYHTGQSRWTEADLPDLMFDRRLYRDGAQWKYDGTPVQWSGNAISDLFTFYAYAPFGSADNGITVNGDGSAGGIPTLTYTVPADVTKQPDLMVAVPRVDIVKPSSGCVSLNMMHALTTIGFQVAGNGEQITGLSVSGVSMSGTLAMDGGNIEWTDLDTPPSADFGASINFDDGQDYYTATPNMSTGLMKDDGYLMMIPQTLDDNAALIVTYADGTSIDINIDPHEWLPGRKIIYELTIVPGGAIVVEPSEITMPYVAAKSEMVVDCSDSNGNPAPSLAWTLSTSEAWLTLSLDSEGADRNREISGAGTHTVYVFSTLNDTGANRTAAITLNGADNTVTTVLQHYSAAQRFARSNIVMYVDGNGNKVLTFAETEADHTTPKSVTYYDASTAQTVTNTVPAIAANVQGLHFRWGSLVGVTGNSSNPNFNGGTTGAAPSTVVFWPAEYAPNIPAAWVFNNNGANVANQVPYIGSAEMGAGGQYSFDGYPNGTGPGFDKAAAKGDICRYISDMGWVRNKWRMPTSSEIIALLSETPTTNFYGYNGRIIGDWTDSEPVAGTGQNGLYGYSRIPDVRVVGKGTSPSGTSASLMENPGVAKVVFPAAGYREAGNGRLSAVGSYGFHWTATSSGYDFALVLDYHDYTNHPSNNFGRANGYSVRCVME